MNSSIGLSITQPYHQHTNLHINSKLFVCGFSLNELADGDHHVASAQHCVGKLFFLFTTVIFQPKKNPPTYSPPNPIDMFAHALCVCVFYCRENAMQSCAHCTTMQRRGVRCIEMFLVFSAGSPSPSIALRLTSNNN